MLAGVSSTTRMRSFMGASRDAACGRGALEQRVRLAEGIGLDVLLERLEVRSPEQGAEQLPIAVEDVGRGGVEVAQQLLHLRDPLLEEREVRGWRRGRGRDGRVPQRGT